MGGKGSGGVNTGLANEAYNNFKGYGSQSGGNINDWPGYTQWASSNPSLVPYATAGWSAGKSARQQQSMVDNMMEAFKAPEQKTPEPPDPLTVVGTDYGSLENKLGKLKEGQGYFYNNGKWGIYDYSDMPEGYTRGYSYTGTDFGEGINKRDQAYKDYMDAANQATSYINDLIAKEKAQAALRGVDYNITDKQKKERINNYFANLWDEGAQTNLENLMKEFGKPKGFEDFIVVRGTPTETNTNTEQPTTTSTGMKPVLTSDDEDELGNTTTILGG